MGTMDAPPHENKVSLRLSWKINNFFKLNTRKLYSDVFYAGGYKWRVIIYPKVNITDNLSISLEVADSRTLPLGWNVPAKFSLSVVNQVHEKHTIRKEACHQFNALEDERGFTSFMPLSRLYNTKGYLVNDTCIVEVDLDLILPSTDGTKKVLDDAASVFPNASGTSHKKVADSGASNTSNGYPQGILSTPKTISISPTNRTPSGNIVPYNPPIISNDTSREENSNEPKVNWREYSVNASLALVLDELIKCHGDIFGGLNLNSAHLRLVAVETAARVALILSKCSLRDLNDMDRAFLFSSVSDLSSLGIRVGWLEEKVSLIKGAPELYIIESKLEEIVKDRANLQTLLGEKARQEVETRSQLEQLKAKYVGGILDSDNPIGF